MRIDSLRAQLETVNRDLAHVTGLEPVPLSFQAGQAEQDPLFLYGIVGGKDVGKTSLINQLAGSNISVTTNLLDEGTGVAVAYCHRSDVPLTRQRLTPEAQERLIFVPHDRDELKNVVLIDFPDFDSRFLAHREDVKRLGKLLQGMVWVITPRKYADREFIDQLETVALSNKNYYVVLNKIDQVDGKENLESVREEVLTYLERECARRNIPAPHRDRFLMIAAVEPEQYEFCLLFSRLIRAHSPEEITRAKIENIRAEFSKNVGRLRYRYNLAERIEQIDQAVSFVHASVIEQFDENYFETVRRRVLCLETIRRRISGNLFAQRIDGWPILRALFYPLAGLVALLGGRLAFAGKELELDQSPRTLLRFEGRSASSRVAETREKLEEQFPQLQRDLGDLPDYAVSVEEEFTRLLQEYEDEVTARLAQEIRPPGIFRKILVYFPLAWFPFLQPVLLHLLERGGGLLSIEGWQELLGVLVSLLGAGSLLEAVVFLLLFYGIWLIWLYARSAARVVKEGQEEFRNTWYQRFVPWTVDLLSRPLLELHSSLAEKNARLDEIERSVEDELRHLASSQCRGPVLL